MKLSLVISLATLPGVFALHAQNPNPEPTSDPVIEAIRQFHAKPTGKPNEVTVVLPPPAPSSADKTPPAPENKDSAEESPPKAHVLVTGNPPEDSEVLTENPENPAPDKDLAAPADAPSAPRESLSVRVEKVKTGNGQIDPSKVKLSAPFPAKPLAPAPAGWRLESSAQVPPFTREVELSPGRKITLTIRPHLLVPDADGSSVFSVSEPGFEPSLAYQQASTVGAILSTSVRQLEEDSKQMGTAIEKLQQLLGSLPKSEPPPPPPTPDPKTPVKTPTNKTK
jgi:hypothetical protein